MKIGIVGGGPAGLYTALLMKKASPGDEVSVLERNRPDDTFGWGVVFSDETLDHFLDADAATHDQITEHFVHWDAIETHFKGEVIRSGGHGFSGVSRRRLLQILQSRCGELGVDLRFSTEVASLEQFEDADLVVAADGVNSRVRAAYADSFGPDIEQGRSKFIWLGTTNVFKAFKFFIRDTPHGIFQVHAYPFDAETSTFIIETDEEAWRGAGLDKMSVDEGVRWCEQLFAEELAGHPLRTNKSDWINFQRVKCATWHTDRVVLIGDAAHTAHFSIGSGTKLAMEDAIALVDALGEHSDVASALAAYQEARWVDVAKLQKSAMTSRHWFENIRRYRNVDPIQFTVSMLTRSKRVTHDNLRIRDPGFIAQVDEWFAKKAGVGDKRPVPPPMFTPFSLRDVELPNRVVVSSMCMYSAKDGCPDDWQLVHLGSRAIGGAGLVMTEMTNVSAEARITPGCTGIYNDAHVAGWKRVTDFVHARSKAKVGIQLGHAGRKGSTRLMWEGIDQPLTEGNWPIVAPSSMPYHPHSQAPRPLERTDMDAIVADYRRATERAIEAGFDLVEVHLAHGYLLASFISPLTNKRTDEYGGSLHNRMRFPLEVLDAVREAWPEERPVSVRISATDWAPGGLSGEDCVGLAKALGAHGADLIDVSTGQTTPDAQPVYGRMFQTPFADRIRHETGIATMAVGAILGWDHCNTIVASGRADLCAMARPHLFDPYLTLHAAADQGYGDVAWPDQYLVVKPQDG